MYLNFSRKNNNNKNPNKVQTQLEKLVLFGQKIREIIISFRTWFSNGPSNAKLYIAYIIIFLKVGELLVFVKWIFF